jgi:hypothetical protein
MFRKQFETAKALNLNILDLAIYQEVYNNFDGYYSIEKMEKIANFVKEIYLTSDYNVSINTIVNALIEIRDFFNKDILDIDYRTREFTDAIGLAFYGDEYNF